jgi:hypothetical protein
MSDTSNSGSETARGAAAGFGCLVAVIVGLGALFENWSFFVASFKGGHGIGEEGVVRCCPIVSDELDSAKEYREAAAIGDRLGVSALFDSGRVYRLELPEAILVIKLDGHLRRVRLITGRHKGAAVWLDAVWLSERPFSVQNTIEAADDAAAETLRNPAINDDDRSAALDSFHLARTWNALYTGLEATNIPRETKRQLWKNWTNLARVFASPSFQDPVFAAPPFHGPVSTPSDPGFKGLPDIQPILDPVKVDNSVKSEAWETFYGTNDKTEFRQRLDAIQLPLAVKQTLWFMKFPDEFYGTVEQALRSASATPQVKTAAFDAFYDSKSWDALKTNLDRSGIPNDTKAQLWQLWEPLARQNSSAPYHGQTEQPFGLPMPKPIIVPGL